MITWALAIIVAPLLIGLLSLALAWVQDALARRRRGRQVRERLEAYSIHREAERIAGRRWSEQPWEVPHVDAW